MIPPFPSVKRECGRIFGISWAVVVQMYLITRIEKDSFGTFMGIVRSVFPLGVGDQSHRTHRPETRRIGPPRIHNRPYFREMRTVRPLSSDPGYIKMVRRAEELEATVSGAGRLHR
jgi:hypothetical protein